MDHTKEIHTLARAVIIHQDHLLLAYDPRDTPRHYYQQKQKFYYLPGGHIEHSESATAAVLREVQEELGHTGSSPQFVGIMEHSWPASSEGFPPCHTHEINLFFVVNVPTISCHSFVAQQEDHVAFQWMHLRDLNDIDLRPTLLKQLIPQWHTCPPQLILHSEFIQ